MTTKVVHVNSEEWKNTPEDQRVYIGRAMPRRGFKGSKWANPFKIVPGYRTREEAINAYASLLWDHIAAAGPLGVEGLEELRGKVLGCWCKPEECHGDCLAWLLDVPPEEYERWFKAAGDLSMLDCWDPKATEAQL